MQYSFKEIDGNYYLCEGEFDISIEDYKEFCELTKDVEIAELLQYCKANKKIVITADDIQEFCKTDGWDLVNSTPKAKLPHRDSFETKPVYDNTDTYEALYAKAPCLKDIEKENAKLLAYIESEEIQYSELFEWLEKKIANREYYIEQLAKIQDDYDDFFESRVQTYVKAQIASSGFTTVEEIASLFTKAELEKYKQNLIKQYKGNEKIVSLLKDVSDYKKIIHRYNTLEVIQNKLIEIDEKLESDFDGESDNAPSIDSDAALADLNNMLSLVDNIKSEDDIEKVAAQMEEAKQNLEDSLNSNPDITKYEMFEKIKKVRLKHFKTIQTSLKYIKSSRVYKDVFVSEEVLMVDAFLTFIKGFIANYEYQLTGFMKALSRIKKECESKAKAKNGQTSNEDQQSLDSEQAVSDEIIDKDNAFNINPKEITVVDVDYWVKFASLATILSVILVPSWPVGLMIPTPAGLIKIPLPVIYLNLGVIQILDILIVPFLGISGICPSPVIFLMNLGDIPLGVIGAKGAFVITYLRNALVEIKGEMGSKCIKPIIIMKEGYEVDIAPVITNLLQLFLQEDLPPYKRLKLTNILFMLLFLINFVKAGKEGCGFSTLPV